MRDALLVGPFLLFGGCFLLLAPDSLQPWMGPEEAGLTGLGIMAAGALAVQWRWWWTDQPGAVRFGHRTIAAGPAKRMKIRIRCGR